MDKHLVLMFVVMGITLAFSYSGDSKELRKQSVICVSIVMALFSGLRTWWFGDLIKYYTLYTQCTGPAGWARVWEEYANAGIRLFFWAMGNLGISYDICIFLIAVFSAVTLGVVVFRYSPSPYWSYLVYIAMGFYMFTYSGLKQTIAMGFLMLAAMGIFEGKPKKFLIWTLVGGFFHVPAFVFLPAYYVSRKKFTRKYLLAILVATVCIFVFRDQIVRFFSAAYYDDEGAFTTDGQIGGRTVMMILILIAAVFLRPLQSGDRVYTTTFNLMIIAAMIQYFGMYNNVFTRLADYYYQFIALFMPLMMETGSHQLKAKPKYKVKQNAANIYFPLYVGITLFAIWFYKGQIDGGQIMLRDFKFVWEINPYDLYGH